MRAFKCYRWVNTDLTSQHGKIQWTVGEWVKHEGELSLCESGLHACRSPLDSLEQVWGSRWFQAEARGKIESDESKFCASEMRLVREVPEKVIRRFALDCAEHVYGLWEREYPDDLRVRVSLDATRAYLDDPTPVNGARMHGAAGAAWAAGAVRAAAGAARAAAGAARAAGAAGAAGAAWAARAARAAGAAEEKWQRQHLKQLLKESSGG